MTGTASLTIVNAVTGSSSLYTNFGATAGKETTSLQWYSTAAEVGHNSWSEFGSYSGIVDLAFSQTTDSLKVIWSGSVTLPIGSINSLFLSGDTTTVDTVTSVDNIPDFPQGDSLAGVRFANLSKGSLPMTVNIKGNPATQTEFSGLGYQQVSAFKSYSAVHSIGGSYSFEIRDQASGNLLATYTWRYTLEKCMTIVITGTSSLSFFTVNSH
jgi:hypothetical protein